MESGLIEDDQRIVIRWSRTEERSRKVGRSSVLMRTIVMNPVLETDGIPEDAAKTAKRVWEGWLGIDLSVTKPRKPEWLAQNLDNPFRGWNGAEHIPTASAKNTASQYRKTRSRLMKLASGSDGDTQAQALEAVEEYVRTFNRSRFIETDERDEIYMVLCEILDAILEGVLDRDSLICRFDEMRDF